MQDIAVQEEKKWYEFNYHGGHKITVHECTPSFIEKVRAFAESRGIDVVIRETRP